MGSDVFPSSELGPLCAKIGSGATPRGGGEVYLAEGAVSLIRSQNVYNNFFARNGLVYLRDVHAKQLSNVAVEAGDILLNITGDSVARCCRVASEVLPARVNQHVAIIRPEPCDLDSRFLQYVFVSPQMQGCLLSLAHAGATRKALTKGMIESLEVLKPDLRTQQAIAEILGSLDDKIELNRRMNGVLESMARAIFKAWFIDFEPVRAKAAGATSFPGMPQSVFDGLPDRLVDSELGEIPEGWGGGTLGDVLDITMGQSPPSKYYNEDGEGLPFHQGVRDYGFRFPTHRIYCTLEARLAEAGDVLLSVRAPVGRINVANRRIVIGRGLAGARHPNGFESYTIYLLKHLFAVEDAVGDGTIYKAITKKFLFSMNVVCPPEALIADAERLLRPLDELLGNNERESGALAQIRDTLLPKLISGELRVPAGGINAKALGRGDGRSLE